jgi:hypothetical protein
MIRRRASRDENEPEIVSALRKAGYMVTPISCAGVPDLLVIKPWDRNPIHTARTAEEALEKCRKSMITLLEVKNPEKPKSDQRLTRDQVDWWTEALGKPISSDAPYSGE